MTNFLMNHISSISILSVVTCAVVINWMIHVKVEKNNKSALSETVSPPASKLE